VTGLVLAAQDVLGTFGWLAVWLVTLVAGVVAIVRRRSAAGACLGVAAILGLGLQICGGTVVAGLRDALVSLPFTLGNLFAMFVRSLGDVVLYALLVAGVLLQRPPPARR
jgi:hypothetical protein